MVIRGFDKVIFLLVGYKSDLQSIRCVSVQEVEELVIFLGMVFLEILVKNNCNVDLVFDIFVDVIQQVLQYGDIKLEEDWGGVRFIYKI